MLEKIIVIPDSFKNTMESKEVAEIIRDGLLKNNNTLNVLTYPVADGGEGTAIIFSEYLGLDLKKMKTTNAFNKEIEIEYGSDGEKAVIDIASVVGFTANVGEKLNPSIATTYGIGKVLRQLLIEGHKKIYVGLGGSITNDLGLGMISAMGVRFFDVDDVEFIPVGNTFANISRIDVGEFCCDCEIVCLSDVKSPLFGPTGAAKMFAKQKGADDIMIEKLEKEGKEAATVISRILGDFTMCPGSGAAGGLGFAFKTFLNAKINSGIEEILKISNVEKEIVDNTILITGEGKFDNQSVQGKVISGIVEMSKNKKAKVIVVAGCVDLTEDLVEVDKIFSCSELGRSIDDVKKTCKEDLNKAVNEMYKYIEEKYL